jgi:undecaprenyl diphosphate synthase
MEAVPVMKSSSGVPAHVAIIMDGNGRWARARSLPRIFGHRRGAEVAREILKSAAELGISYLTLYSFSSENWKRPVSEIDDLMGLFRVYLRSEVAELHRSGVRLRLIGDRRRIPADIVTLAEHAEKLTAGNTRIQLILAVSYGSREEIVVAARRLAEAARSGEMDPASIDEAALSHCLYTRDVPDPDLVIRTSGEKRLSNFLLWQAAYAELVFTETLWPDFTRRDLEDAISEFHRRDRRYGATGG